MGGPFLPSARAVIGRDDRLQPGLQSESPNAQALLAYAAYARKLDWFRLSNRKCS